MTFWYISRLLPSPVTIRHQNGFFRQLMEANAEIKCQILHRGQGSLGRGGERIVGARWVKDTIRKPKKSTNMAPLWPIETESLAREYAWD